MRTTVTIDDDLLKKARSYTGYSRVSELLEQALKAMVSKKNIDDILTLAKTKPDMKMPTRRKYECK